VRGTLLCLLLALPAAAGPEAPEPPADGVEASLLRRWRDAGPDERRHLQAQLDALEEGYVYAAARPVLVDFEGRTVPLAELFERVLLPALATPPAREGESAPTLVEAHLRALAALEALREAYAPPRPVRTGTLNLMLEYAFRVLDAHDLPPALRARFFTEAVRNVRMLDGRVRPDARTAWLLHARLLPALLALARRAEEDDDLKATVSEAASLLYLPSILDDRAQAQLAPLTSSVHGRDVLVRFYRAGILDEMGRVSLARSVAALARDDAAFAAGAGPLLLELLTDPGIPPPERGLLADVVAENLGAVELLRPMVGDLLAVAYGGPPRPLAAYAEERERRKGGLARPQGERVFRFLSVVLLQEDESVPPVVARVLRADLRAYEPLYTDDGRGGRAFVGTLVPDVEGGHADFLGPPPRLSGARDNRLLRRRLRLERISIQTFGTRGEEVELCVTLPEDASEPVPPTNAGLGDVVALVGARLRTGPAADERDELVRLLVRIGTDEAKALAARYADTTGALEALLPLAEQGNVGAARTLLARLGGLAAGERENALAAVLASGRAELVADVAALCAHEDVGIAVLAADALLARGDPSGVPALLRHPDRYARGAGAALALRLTPLAGSLRVTPKDPPDLAALAALADKAFTKEDGDSWVKLGRFARVALADPEAVRARRHAHKPLYLGKRTVQGWEFADAYTSAVAAGEAPELYPALIAFLLDPADPGAGIPDRHLGPLLDALEDRTGTAALRPAWRDGLVVLACAQHGLEFDAPFLDLATTRLGRLAGKDAPREAHRKPGVYWPIWAAGDAAAPPR